MRELLTVRGGLHTLRWGTRFSYTLYLVFSLAAYAVMVALAISGSGVTDQSIVLYYKGDEAQLAYGMGRRELLELTHFHLFAMPLYLFVQGHLFLLTRWPLRWKVLLVVAASLGIAGDLAAPWLVIDVSPAWAPMKNVARVLMAVPFVAFAVVPLWEMWGPRPTGGALAEPG